MENICRMLLSISVWLSLLLVPNQAMVVTKSRAAAVATHTVHNISMSGAAMFDAQLTASNLMVAAAAPAAAVPGYPWAKCSTDPAHPVVMDSGEACPPDCPFSQMVEGQHCDKLCVHASQCRQFHPVLFFADIRTMQCTPSCGARKAQQIAGCSECLGPGMCKRCARGLFGLTSLELSEDGTKCVNVTMWWWNLFYLFAGLVLLSVVVYIVVLGYRKPENEASEKRFQTAQSRREEARTEFLNNANTVQTPEPTFRESSFHNIHTASMHGGRGVVLYFNWLLFGMLVALTLACGHFVAYELSDLGRHSATPKACMVTDAVEDYDGVTGVSTYVVSGNATVHVEKTTTPTKGWDDWSNDVLEIVRDSARVVANEAPPTGSIAERYTQVHVRMFKASITMYVIVVLLVFGFTIYQLGWVTARFADQEPQVRGFAACVSGLPKDLFHGQLVTDHFREVFKSLDLASLWQEHGGPRKDELNYVPLEDRFWVVGTSIAYDYNSQQEAVDKEVDSWIYDLDSQNSSVINLNSRTANAGPAQSNATSRGMQTETRGEILEQMRETVPKHVEHPMFDKPLMKFVGLEEEVQMTLHGSGSAFVVFATEAARDAVVSLAKAKKLPKFTMPQGNDPSRSPQPTGLGNALGTNLSLPQFLQQGPGVYRLGVEATHCEPVSIKWENFGPLSNFAVKILMSILAIIMTMFVWIGLSLPSAMFIADLALIPGVRPGFVQNLILGLLIAIGNQLIAVVVDLVTGWMGFLYKDSRDCAVLALAFMGTLIATVFDLSVVAVTAHGMVLESAFQGRDAGYEPVVANEIFGLTVPGYLVLPYLGMPIGEHVLPYFLAKFLIRSHGKINLRSATKALRSPQFDICWRYSDILNNTSICVVLLYFTSNRAWMTMTVLFLFMVIIYVIDKYLLLHVATPGIYDTHRLSTAFSMWWCLPTTMLAGLVSYWGYRSSSIPSVGVCAAIPCFHVFFFMTVLCLLEGWLAQSIDKEPAMYPDMVRRLQKEGKPWDYFNTNPVFCLRTRFLGADATGWKEVTRFLRSSSGAYVLQEDGASPKMGEQESDECLPFVRGSLRVLASMFDKQVAFAKQV